MKIDGKIIAQKIKDELKKKIATRSQKPGLAIVLVGDDLASHTYVRLKEKACEEIGMHFEKHLLPIDEDKEDVLSLIQTLNNNPKIHGVIIQLPLPKHLPTQEIIDALSPNKDADGFHPKNNFVKPVLAEVILEILKETGENVREKQMLILGNSPVFLNSLKNSLDPFFKKIIFSTNSSILASMEELSQIDILVSAQGKANAIKPEHIPYGIGLIDIGINKVDEKIVGDVDPNCYEKAKFYTPVPGGVGPITVAKLLENVYKLFLISIEKQSQEERPK